MGSALRFWWNATRGHRLRPWRSPYLRWRIETFSGVKADQVDRHVFFGFLWQQRRQLMHFLRWTGEMQEYAAGREPK
jgi:hypothetical protein